MRLTRLHIRFFRSFNFDYLRKAGDRAREVEWELIEGTWFPFVRIRLDPDVTAVVGANEAGKSHLIAAIRAALSGEGIGRGDFAGTRACTRWNQNGAGGLILESS